MTGRNITIWFMGLALALIIIYDIYAYLKLDSTISSVVYWWADYSFVFKYMLIAGVNFLMGHLLWGQKIYPKSLRGLLFWIEQRPNLGEEETRPWVKELDEKAKQVKGEIK